MIINAFFDLFEEDSKNKSVLIEHFYPFFQYVFQQEGYKRIKRINDIAKRYYNNNPYFEYLYQELNEEIVLLSVELFRY